MSDEKSVRIETERFSELACDACGTTIPLESIEPFTEIICPSCGGVHTVPARFGQFTLLKLLGTGGMGGVYYAHDDSLGRFVAIKVMLASLGADTDFVETFRREAQAAARLNNPHVAQIYSFGQEKGQPYIVMELVSGEGFDKMVEGDEPLSPRLVMSVGLDIAEGLQAADEVGLVHGDIKPENILLDEKRSAKIVDFGIAQQANQAQEGIWGTPYYISPEKILRQRVDAKSDIYSLGATLYHALGGQPPFEGETPIEVVRSRLVNDPPNLREIRPDIPEEVERIIMRMLQRDQAMRYPTYASLISDIRKAVNALGGSLRGGSRKGKKRVVIKSKRGAQSPPPPPEAPGEKSNTASHPQIVIHKGKTLTIRKSETGDADESSKEKPKRKPKQAPTPEQIARRKKALRTTSWILVGIVVAIAALAILAWIKVRKDQTEALRREWYTLRVNRESALQTFQRITPMAARIAAASNRAQACVEAVQNASQYVLGAPIDPPEPEVTPPEEAAADGEPNDEDTDTAAASRADEDAGGEEPVPDPVALAGQPPPGMMSPEALKQARGEAEANAEEAEGSEEPEAADAESAETGFDAEAADAEPEPPEEPEPEIRVIGRTVLANANRMNTIAGRAAATYREARQALTVATNTLASHIAVTQAAVLKEQAVEMENLVEAADETMQAVESATEKVVAIETKARQADEARRRAEEERQRREAEAAEAERKRQEHAAQVDRERMVVDTAYEGIKPLLKVNQFAEATESLKAQTDGIETSEARDALNVYLERCRYLRDMKAILIRNLNDRPFQWGWGRAGTAKDVLGASDTHVKIVGAQVPWNEVTPGQMLRFVNHYLKSTDIRLRHLADLSMGAAVYCYEHGGVEAARGYAERAMGMLPNMEQTAYRLLPIFEQTNQEGF